ncbi:MAG: 2-isopropylmalate synthase [bacterium]|nr:2-isopropylmalate synthase [bacterium]
MKDRILIFDTLMRDGEQAGHPMSVSTKVAIARRLERLNVDIIEFGFPISSAAEIEAGIEISKAVSKPILCALAGVRQSHIEAAVRSLEFAKKPRIHVFVSTSDRHIKNKLQSTREQVLEWIHNEVRRAKQYFSDIQFSAEDATRTDPDYLIETFKVAVDAGANTLNVPDTGGYFQPIEYGELIDEIYIITPREVVIAAHCHDDLGLAVANSLAGIRNGANQVEGCFLGIGERAGNAALEEIIMALHTRGDFYEGLSTGINLSELWPFLNFLSGEIGYPIPFHKAIAGANAFGHSSGIHADGVLKDRLTYEIMKPEEINWQGSEGSLTSHLGEAGLADRLKKLGYDDLDLASQIISEFKALGNIVGRMSNDDLHMLIQEYYSKKEMVEHNLFAFSNDGISFASTAGVNNGTVVIQKGGLNYSAHAVGDGPVDAVCNAIDLALTSNNLLIITDKEVQFNVIHGSGGSEALGSVRAKVKIGDDIGYGRASDINLVKAYARAYLDAFNHLMHVPVSEEKEELRKVYD